MCRESQDMRNRPAPVYGSYDDGDPTTTNLYVGNLAPDVTEAILEKEFGRFGKLGGVRGGRWVSGGYCNGQEYGGLATLWLLLFCTFKVRLTYVKVVCTAHLQ